MTSKTFKIPIYFDYLCVIHTQELGTIAKKHGLNMEHLLSAFTFKVDTEKRTTYYVVFKEAHLDIICHEAVHVVNMIFKDRGIYLDASNDEPQAYFTGWIVKKICMALKIKIDPIN